MNVFEQLYGIIGEITEGGKTYATAPTPPAGDDSTKVATTAWVKDKTPSIPSGNVAVWSRDFTLRAPSYGEYERVYAPAGGTWFCWGTYQLWYYNNNHGQSDSFYGVIRSGGAQLSTYIKNGGNYFSDNSLMAIKIA